MPKYLTRPFAQQQDEGFAQVKLGIRKGGCPYDLNLHKDYLTSIASMDSFSRTIFCCKWDKLSQFPECDLWSLAIGAKQSTFITKG